MWKKWKLRNVVSKINWIKSSVLWVSFLSTQKQVSAILLYSIWSKKDTIYYFSRSQFYFLNLWITNKWVRKIFEDIFYLDFRNESYQMILFFTQGTWFITMTLNTAKIKFFEAYSENEFVDNWVNMKLMRMDIFPSTIL